VRVRAHSALWSSPGRPRSQPQGAACDRSD
jgi:hypothetical protein